MVPNAKVHEFNRNCSISEESWGPFLHEVLNNQLSLLFLEGPLAYVSFYISHFSMHDKREWSKTYL